MPSRVGAVLLALLASVAGSGPAASGPAAAERGAAVIETWCRDCHPRPDQDRRRFDAPPYEEIVTWPGRDLAYFRRFLAEDHFPMPTFRLFDAEKADVVAYLMALQARAPRP
ncbi:hypothetical protein GWI72_03985 [Microvirga tunisiensis]|uniref:Uncharacterized protein n=3 Tax=Pannonibacter tanglangensis TaxID=2750084 RepID=A0A7X5F0B6_9HYPH|nr:hypothetical protein [Pannonibacter sp. XCT-34]NBN77423.1 hypothetical protein [Pannonibacter sp. XCT-53]